MSPSSADSEPAVSVHHAVLAFISASLFVALVAAATPPFSIPAELALGNVPATGTIGYALFYNPPSVE